MRRPFGTGNLVAMSDVRGVDAEPRHGSGSVTTGISAPASCPLAGMPVTVRPATPADRPALEIVRRQALEAALSGRYDRGAFAELVAEPEAELETWLSSDRFSAVVAETAVTPAAFAVGDRRTGEVVAVYTAPDYERRGYATRALERVEQGARSAGLEELTVWTPEPSVGFFTAAGFEPEEGRRVVAGVPHVRLWKALGDDR